MTGAVSRARREQTQAEVAALLHDPRCRRLWSQANLCCAYRQALDVGCGVGGPMRTIASTSGANVTGLTINDYQVSRAKYHNEKVGLPIALACDNVSGSQHLIVAV